MVFWLAHPNLVKVTVALLVLTVIAILIAIALDFDLDPHDDALEPRYPPIPRHVRIHSGSRPFDWGTDPDTAYLTGPKDLT